LFATDLAGADKEPASNTEVAIKLKSKPHLGDAATAAVSARVLGEGSRRRRVTLACDRCGGVSFWTDMMMRSYLLVKIGEA